MAKLTDRAALSADLALTDLFHGVDVSDVTQDPAGSSYKVTLQKVHTLLDYESVTKSALDALVAAETLIQGKLYFISDRNIFIRAVSTSKLELSGHLLSINADYQSVGDYSGIAGFNSQLGIWNSGLTPVANDVVIYGNRHYLNLTGAVGTAPDGDAVNWVIIAFGATNGYVYEIDSIEYDYDNDWIQKRTDKRGTDYKITRTVASAVYPSFPSNPMDEYQWGNDSWIANKINNGFISDGLNSLSSVLYNDLENASRISILSTGLNQTYYTNKLHAASTMTVSGSSDNINFNNNTTKNSASFSVTLNENALCTSNTIGISTGVLSFSVGNNSQMQSNEFDYRGTISNKTIADGIQFNRNVIKLPTTASETISSNVNDKRIESGFSNREASIISDTVVTVTYDNLAVSTFQVGEIVTNGVTGATGEVVTDNGTDTMTLKDVTGRFNNNDTISGGTSGSTADVNNDADYPVLDIVSGNASSANYGKGILNVTSTNTNEIYDDISNTNTLYPFEIRPASGKIITFISGTLKLSGGVDLVLDGSNGDWVRFEKRGSTIYQLTAETY